MNENNALQQLWDEFLTTWPLERIETMSLSEYVSIQNKTTFTYWLETKTQPLANIKGSPSPKFGIYKRNSDPKERSGMTHGSEYSWWNKFGKTEQEAFESVRCEIIKIIKAAEIGDLKSIDDVTLAPVYKWKIAFMYQNQNSPTIVNIFAKDKLAELTELPQSSSYLDFYRTLIANYSSNEHLNIAEYGRKCWAQLDHEKIDSDDALFTEETVLSKEKNTMQPLNQILYGPPGTGKTYHTIEAAVKAAEPEYYASLNINPEYGANNEQRKLLQDKYLELSKGNRIRFVTFHQSYGYEEFVEGLRAVSNEYNQVEYSIKSGVFKQLCQAASSNGALQSNQINSEPRIWKISIDGTKVSQIRTYCFANNLAAIGWGETGDMSSEERTEEEHIYFDSLGTQSKSSVFEFTNRMMKGDIVVCVKGQWSIQAVGVVSGDYQYRPDGLLDRPDFCHFMPVNWLATDLDVELYSLNDNTRLTLKTCYELDRFTQAELFEHLNKNDIDLADYSNSQDPVRNYVLVIDEINRGNISKIFGELITLIEPSKRKPNTKDDEIDESITLTLPYSGKPFSVPDNLHIIGTMNTADRSLAMMDTALRRRFDFIEMMPKPELLENVIVNWNRTQVDLTKLLAVLNERIEILYDREHTLGHAFFMPVKALVDVGEQEKAFSALVSVFQNKIIPLLEEYFFEDWDKIRLVLADNQKEETLQFVSEKLLNNSKLSALFGNKHGLNQYGETQKQYILKNKSDDVWKNAQAYKDIYAASDKQGE